MTWGFTPSGSRRHCPAYQSNAHRQGSDLQFPPGGLAGAQSHPALVRLLSRGASPDAAAQERYHDLMEQRPDTSGQLLNLTAAMAQTPASSGTPLDYLSGEWFQIHFRRRDPAFLRTPQ